MSASKYFNQPSFVDDKRQRQNIKYENDIIKVLSNSNNRRKIMDSVLTNEMNMTNLNNIETSPMEFQIGGFNPMVSTQFFTKLFDSEKEDLAIQINNISIDSPIEFENVLTNMNNKMRFLLDGGTDCILVYLTTENNVKIGTVNSDNTLNWNVNNNVYILPILSSQIQFDVLLKALHLTLIKDNNELDKESRDSSNCSLTLSLRKMWKTIIDIAYPEGDTLPSTYQVFMIDFFNKLSVDGADLLRKSNVLFNLSDHLLNIDLRNFSDIYEEKSTEGGLPQNELGCFFSSICKCSEAIYYPCLFEKWNTEFKNFQVRQSVSAFLNTNYTGQNNSSTECLENNTGNSTYFHYFPQNYNPIVNTNDSIVIEGFIPIINRTNDVNILKIALARLYPFLWITREDAYSLGGKKIFHIWNNKLSQLKQIIKIYGFYSQSGHIAYQKESPIDFINLFGECSVVIPQARSFIHNMRQSRISSVLKFISVYNYEGKRCYVPELITPSIINIWDKESALSSSMKILILSQKFGSTPPFKIGTKLNMIVSIYAYYQ